jgi:uncharacterized cupin superfamily protein
MPPVPEWFVVNVADAAAVGNEVCGYWAAFEDPEAPFADFGINIHVIQPGQPNAKYHSESVQEDFLVLSGECLAIIDGEERPLRAWDLVHCPAGTEHVFVGAGDGPCAILMVGARRPGGTVHYPVNELAAKHGASAAEPTASGAEAYADWSDDFTETRLEWPPA